MKTHNDNHIKQRKWNKSRAATPLIVSAFNMKLHKTNDNIIILHGRDSVDRSMTL